MKELRTYADLMAALHMSSYVISITADSFLVD